MPFEKFRQQQHRQWVNEGHLVDGENWNIGLGRAFGPGQRETKQTGGLMEGRTLPIAQAETLGAAIFVSVLILYLNAILAGPVIGLLLGLIAICFSDVAILRKVKAELQKIITEDNQVDILKDWGYIVYFGSGLGIISAIMWLVTGPGILVNIWPLASIQYLIPLWVKATFAVFTLPVFLVPCALLVFRMSYEIFNGNWPPPYMAVQPRGPFTLRYEQPENDDGKAEIMAMLEDAMSRKTVEVPRIVTRYDARNPNPSGSHIQDRLIESSERVHKAQSEPITDRVIAPSGRTVRVGDLNEFIIDGTGIGIAYRTWNKRKGWGYEYWSALVDTCANHGLVTNPAQRNKTKLLIESRREAVEALDNLWKHVFPDENASPHPTIEPVLPQTDDTVNRQTNYRQTDS